MNLRYLSYPAAVCLAVFGIFGVVEAQTSASLPPTAAPDVPGPARAAGYLGRDGIPDHEQFLPPPPADNSPLGIADVAIYRSTRSLENSDRWRMAAEDAEIGSGALLSDFSCALGADLGDTPLPELSELLGRAMADLGPIIGDSKSRYQRPRPFVAESAPVCVTPSERLAASGSYPSGHAATGWLYALVLAAIDPEHGADILARGRTYGESRVVCGMHYVSDVDAGRMASTALLAVLSADPDFQHDLQEARAELAARRLNAAGEPDGATCSLAESAAASRPW